MTDNIILPKTMRIFTLFVPFILLSYVHHTSGYDMSIPPAKQTYNILMLHPFCSPSHQIPYIVVAKALAERGHKVTFMSALPSNLKHKNIKEIIHKMSHVVEGISAFEINNKDPTGYVYSFTDNLPKLARELYEVPEVMELYNRRNEFDLIITDDMFNEPGYPFLVDKRYAVLSPLGITPQSSSVLGNILNPSFHPSILTEYARPYSFVERLKNLWAHILPAFLWKYVYVVPAIEIELKKKFPTLPPIAEIEKGMGIVLANIHYSLDFATPLLPSQVQVGGIHCHPGEELSQDLQTFINGSGLHGTIYFSLGSVVQDKLLPNEYRDILIQAFSQLKQRVLWKFDGNISDLPENILIKKWVSQQDILAHPNIKLFITHGGLLSLQESIYHKKPLLALPVFGDQMRNAQRIDNMKLGKFLHWNQLSIDLLLTTIKELLNNEIYKNTIKKVSTTYQDQQLSPLENAIWWIEFFIRNEGAPQLHSPAADLSWIEYLMIDVIISANLMLLFSYLIIRKFIKLLLRLIFMPKNSTKKEKKE